MDELHHVTRGRTGQPAILFLHGFMGSCTDWSEIVGRLRRDYFCICTDLPGHGKSTELTASESYSMEGAGDLLRGLLETLGVGAVHVVGYSMGGRAALYFAAHHPAWCRKLVLESASPGLKSETERASRRGVDEARALRLEQDDFDEFLEEWYRQPLFDTYRKHGDLLERMIQSRRANDPDELARVLRGMGTGRQPSLWEDLSGVRAATLAIAGALDGKYVEIAEEMAVLMPNVRTAIIQNAGHNVHAEHPSAFTDIVKDFLKKPT